MIREIALDDANTVCEIYNHYVLNTIYTFEEEAITSREMGSRIVQVTEKYPWLILEEANHILGYAYARPWKRRHSYRYAVETAIYLSHKFTGQGKGRVLYEALISQLAILDVHSLIAGIAQPNPPCVALHKHLDFEQVGLFKEVGWKFNRWIDVEYWELLLRKGTNKSA